MKKGDARGFGGERRATKSRRSEDLLEKINHFFSPLTDARLVLEMRRAESIEVVKRTKE